MLVLDRVSYRYAGARTGSLLDVSLELGAGEVVGVLGASEAGKTTLCLVASGIAPRTVGGSLRGRLLLDGEDVAGRTIHELVDRIGIAFSSPTTQLTGVTETVYEEVAFGPMNLGLPRSDVIARTGAALETLGIGQLAERDPARLSGGQQQLVGIAGLLALGPAHLVLDEPTAHLDPLGTRMVADALRRLAEAGASILLTEQKTDLVEELCTRAIALDAGRVAAAGATAEVLADPRLEELGIALPARARLARAVANADLPPEIRAPAEAAIRQAASR